MKMSKVIFFVMMMLPLIVSFTLARPQPHPPSHHHHLKHQINKVRTSRPAGHTIN